MERRFSIFVRQHANDTFTLRCLTHPDYAAYGTDIGQARDELARVLAGELALGTIGKAETTWHRELRRKTVSLTLRAVQHKRLIELPLVVSAFFGQSGHDGSFHVMLPRLGLRFTIREEAHIIPWAEELIRGRFHLKDVDTVRAHEQDRAERVEDLVVNFRRIDGKRLEQERGPQSSETREALRDNPDKPSDAVFGGAGTDLVQAARNGELGRCYFRDHTLEHLTRMLAARRSVVVVGPSGVGKTTVIHELAHRIAADRAGEALEGRAIWHVPPSRIMAGTIYLGEWQERCLKLVAAARAHGAILYLGDLLELVSVTQSGAGSGMSLPALLGPLLSQRDLTVLVEATPEAVSASEAAEPAFMGRLGRLLLPPLPPDRALTILSRIAQALGRQHSAEFSEAALHRVLDLCARFGDGDGLPGSGVALVSQCARRNTATSTELTPDDITQAFCDQTGFPRDMVDPDRALPLETVEQFFGERVHGQAAATRHMVNVVAILKAGLNDPARPVASFLFSGPTGVGKTETAITLAEYLFGDRKRLVRLDMSEYAFASSALRLVDGPGGQGALTKAIREQPFCVVLLDEVEKAAPEVFDLLLQVLGEGRLTDGTGHTVSFRHAVIIMTSNLGASARPPIGMGSDSGARDYLGAIRRFFRPEFLNRIDHVVPFASLQRNALRSIVARMLGDALTRDGLTRRGVTVKTDDSVTEFLMDVGFDEAMGARPMKRAIDEHVLAPLAERLSASGNTPTGALVLSIRDGRLVFA